MKKPITLKSIMTENRQPKNSFQNKRLKTASFGSEKKNGKAKINE